MKKIIIIVLGVLAIMGIGRVTYLARGYTYEDYLSEVTEAACEHIWNTNSGDLKRIERLHKFSSLTECKDKSYKKLQKNFTCKDKKFNPVMAEAAIDCQKKYSLKYPKSPWKKPMVECASLINMVCM